MKLNFLVGCVLAYLEFFQGNSGICSWSVRFLFDRQKVVIADHHDRERWERYFEPWTQKRFHLSENDRVPVSAILF
jgi:hypothetical protein